MNCLIAANEQVAASLKEIMAHAGQYQITVCQTAGEARRSISRLETDLVIINTPLPDDTGIGLAEDVSTGTDCSVILLVKAELSDMLQEKVEDSGVFVVPKPLSRQLFYTALKYVGAARQKLFMAQKKHIECKRALEDLKIVCKAKCLLIMDGLTEEEAHKKIERDAMNQRKTKRGIAEEIILSFKEKNNT